MARGCGKHKAQNKLIESDCLQLPMKRITALLQMVALSGQTLDKERGPVSLTGPRNY